MGIWTLLDCYDAQRFDAACARSGGDPFANFEDLRTEYGHVAGIHTHRAWHALHVALTGEEDGGPAPAAPESALDSIAGIYLVGGGSGLAPGASTMLDCSSTRAKKILSVGAPWWMRTTKPDS